MTDARGRHQWLQSGSIVAMLYNVNRGKGTKAKQPLDFSPYRDPARPKPKPPKAHISILREAFCKPKKNPPRQAIQRDRFTRRPPAEN